MIPYGRQDIDADDIAAVEAVLRSDFLTQGPAVPAFEQALAQRVGVPHAVAVSSATAALHLSCLALGLGPGDALWTSPNTFVASANCARYCGADVDFVDIDPRTYNLSVERLAERLVRAERERRLPKIVVVVHFAGQPAPMAEIAALAQHYGFRVIEDAAHALGAEDQQRAIGACTYSDATILSFHPVKIITSGEGGAITTRDTVLAERLSQLRSHGITRDPQQMQGVSDGPWYYEQTALGFHYRLTDLQAALGRSQLCRLDGFLARRRELAARYDRLLDGLPLLRPWQDPQRRSAWHLYVVQLLRHPRPAVFEQLRAAGIGVNVHYIPVHLQPYYRALGFGPGDFPDAEAYYARALTLPLHPRLSDAEQDRVVAALAGALP